jgi:hypothetical protein
VLNVGLSMLLIGPYGLLGIAFAVVIAAVVVDMVVIPLLVQWALGLSVLEFLRKACVRPLLVAILQAAVLKALWLTGRPGNWFHLIVDGVISGAACLAIVLVVGVRAEEREAFVFQPLRRILGRSRPAVA